MYKYSQSLLPNIFNGFYTFNYSVHDYNTRQRHYLHVPIARTDMRTRTVRFKGVLTMNYFSPLIDRNCSVYTYKKKLKQYILSNGVTTLVDWYADNLYFAIFVVNLWHFLSNMQTMCYLCYRDNRLCRYGECMIDKDGTLFYLSWDYSVCCKHIGCDDVVTDEKSQNSHGSSVTTTIHRCSIYVYNGTVLADEATPVFAVTCITYVTHGDIYVVYYRFLCKWAFLFCTR